MDGVANRSTVLTSAPKTVRALVRFAFDDCVDFAILAKHGMNTGVYPAGPSQRGHRAVYNVGQGRTSRVFRRRWRGSHECELLRDENSRLRELLCKHIGSLGGAGGRAFNSPRPGQIFRVEAACRVFRRRDGWRHLQLPRERRESTNRKSPSTIQHLAIGRWLLSLAISIANTQGGLKRREVASRRDPPHSHGLFIGDMITV
jgi:hypothetical protein